MKNYNVTIEFIQRVNVMIDAEDKIKAQEIAQGYAEDPKWFNDVDGYISIKEPILINEVEK